MSACGSRACTRDQFLAKRSSGGACGGNSTSPIFTNSLFTGSGTYRSRKNWQFCRVVVINNNEHHADAQKPNCARGSSSRRHVIGQEFSPAQLAFHVSSRV